MNWKLFIKSKILGLDVPNEYVCVGENSFLNPLKILLKTDGDLLDLSHLQVLLGYRPLLMGLYFDDHSDLPNWIRTQDNIRLLFSFTDKEAKKPTQILAHLELKRLHEVILGEKIFFVFEGVSGAHHFLNLFNRFTYYLHESLQPKKPGNIDLPGNLYEQVRIAYSVPRNISIISLGEDGRFNFFPTDLHGAIGEGFYVGSLRHEGKASQQVEQHKKVVIAKVNTGFYREAYLLGKNHMSERKGLEHFTVFRDVSEKWALPLPEGVVSYRELQWMKSLDAGIHRIHFYETKHQKTLRSQTDVLSHIHRYYAKWRLTHGLKTEWLLR